MTIPSAPDFPAPPGAEFLTLSWSDVARHCRRICLLRERGDQVAADQLRSGPLAETLLALRARSGASDAEMERRLEETFVVEQERVANAATLAELIAPLLSENLPRLAPAAPVAPVPRSEPKAPPPRAMVRGAHRNIADFIDEMLDHDTGRGSVAAPAAWAAPRGD